MTDDTWKPDDEADGDDTHRTGNANAYEEASSTEPAEEEPEPIDLSERLGTAAGDSGDQRSEDTGPDDTGADDTGSDDASDGPEADPFEELEELGDFDDHPRAGDLGDEDPFAKMDVDIGETDVWETLDADESVIDIGGEAIPIEETPDHEDHQVEKREYCQRCPHFSEPPEANCTHEESEIVEVIDISTFRVRNCPMVTEEGPQFDRVTD